MYFGEQETIQEFHKEPYLRKLESWLDAIEADEKEQIFAVLDRTIFFPRGGGQLGDRGELILPSGEAFRITDTRKQGESVIHYLDADDQGRTTLQRFVGEEKVQVKLDWVFRYHQMRIHSVAHLIHCFMEKVAGRDLKHPIRSPLGEDSGENRYDYVDGFDERCVSRAIELLNEFCSGDHKIETEADSTRGPGFRWWRCEEWRIPCGGVHPRNTEELGVVSGSMKIRKGTARVAFRLNDTGQVR